MGITIDDVPKKIQLQFQRASQQGIKNVCGQKADVQENIYFTFIYIHFR